MSGQSHEISFSDGMITIHPPIEENLTRLLVKQTIGAQYLPERVQAPVLHDAYRVSSASQQDLRSRAEAAETLIHSFGDSANIPKEA